jgi:hypothetical protein
MCIVDDCNLPPAYGYPSQGIPLFCAICKFPETIYMLMGKCADEGCHTKATYGFKWFEDKLYCKSHALPLMVNKHHVYCEVEVCLNRAYFGTDVATHCEYHKTAEMKCFKAGKCIVKECSRSATVSTTDKGPALYCMVHYK